MNSVFIANPNVSFFPLERNMKSLEEEKMLQYT